MKYTRWNSKYGDVVECNRDTIISRLQAQYYYGTDLEGTGTYGPESEAEEKLKKFERQAMPGVTITVCRSDSDVYQIEG